MILLNEHQKIDPDLLADVSLDDLRRRISYDTRRFEPSKLNLIRYEFDPAAGRDGFYSYYRIGAEWIDSTQSRSLTFTPKIQNIDFLEIFMTCLSTAESDDSFSDIYDIDFEARPVRSSSLSSILSPLLVVQLLMAVSRIVSRGLRRGYVSRAGNLPKVKGRVDIRRDKCLLRALGYDTTDDTSLPIVPCILIYPVTGHTVLDADTLFNHPVKETVNFYTCPLSIPVIR